MSIDLMIFVDGFFIELRNKKVLQPLAVMKADDECRDAIRLARGQISKRQPKLWEGFDELLLLPAALDR